MSGSNPRDPEDVVPSSRAFDAPPVISGLSQIAGDYDIILCDIWGVLHNSVFAFPEACAALENMRRMGAQVVLLSNAPRPSHIVVTELNSLGVQGTSYDAIVTSGDVARTLLEAQTGARVFHIGPRRNMVTFEGLDIGIVALDDAELIVCTDLVHEETETPEDYTKILATAQARSLRLICANPDIVVERGDRLVYCAGAIAQLYEEMGGSVIYCGKPHGPIYDMAIKLAFDARSGLVDRKRVLAIGDALRTDVAGAATVGFDSLFIAGGIHAAELMSENDGILDKIALSRLFSEGPRPIGVLQALTW